MIQEIERGWLTPEWERRVLQVLVAVGIVVRSVRYFLRFPLWEDECFLVWNYVGNGYADLLEPLHPHQVAPVLYLWKQLTVVNLLGFNELSLRLTAFVGGIAVLLLFPRFARRFVSGVPLLFAVALFAISYPCIRYAAEAKQYGVAMVVSFALMAITARWWERPERTRPLWILAVFVPIAIGLSYSAVFVAGGVSLAVACVLLGSGVRRGWAPWAVFNALLVSTFFLIVVPISSGQAPSELAFMRNHWLASFPPVTEPFALAGWFFETHAGQMLGYPVGGGPWLGSLAFLCVVVTFVVAWRRRDWRFLLLAFVPLFLHFVAAALRRYPYGVHAKFNFYLAPMFCVLIGTGASALVMRCARTLRAARRSVIVVITLFLCVGAGSVVRDFANPQKSPSDARTRAFARWFWFDMSHDGEVVCLFRDLGLSFSPQEKNELSWLYGYLCNGQIYAPSREPPDLSRERIRFVRYRVSGFDYDEAAFQRWLAEKKEQFAFVGMETFSMPRYDKRDRWLLGVDHIDVYAFRQK
ncbi:MAG: hypothetical protein V3T86_05985 [Planctomycetota bacterium]